MPKRDIPHDLGLLNISTGSFLRGLRVSEPFRRPVTADFTIRECPAGDEKERCQTEFAAASFKMTPNVGVPLVGSREFEIVLHREVILDYGCPRACLNLAGSGARRSHPLRLVRKQSSCTRYVGVVIRHSNREWQRDIRPDLNFSSR